MKKIISVLAILTVLFSMSGCGKKELEKHEASFLTLFDTVTTVIGYSESDEEFQTKVQTLHDELLIYHQLFDIYNDYDVNNIKTINDNAGKQPVQVDSKIIDLLKFSKEIYELTNGKVNVAMGSVLSIWHDYRTEGIENPDKAKLPDCDALQAAAQHTDINNVVIDEQAQTVYLSDEQMSLDVGAIAKGYAVQQVCSSLKEQGFDHYLVSVGGNVSSIGAKTESGDNWIVGIQSPYELESFVHTVNIIDKSVVTSGNYQRYYTVDGVKYHHIIDPETLFPANDFDAVTIICDDSGLADGLSTALYTMSLKKGQELIESIPNAEAIWILSDGFEVMSDEFNDYIRT